MRKETNLCMNCMGELNDHGTCPLCGLYDTETYISSYLAPKTFLANRYIVGRLISYCGESALYIGFDTVEQRKVTVREYMPDTLCVRERDEEIVTVKHDKLPLYKTYLAEFIELHSTLMNSPAIPCVQTVLDVFSENNTAYAVMDYLGGISLKSYLTNSGEILSWEQVKELFPPLLTALNMLHGLGIIHRGISTSTIFVSEKNQLKLMGFSISAAHTADSDIGYEVFGGFAPPEQYSSARRNGSWTDVYGISAVLYRCLTGITPPTAPERLIEDTLVEPMLINRHVPKNVSDVIMKGMELEADDRISGISEFVDRLFEQPSRPEDNSGEIPVPTIKSGTQGRSYSEKTGEKKVVVSQTKKVKKKAQKDKIKFIAVASVLGVIILGFLLAMIITASGGGDGGPVNTAKPATAPRTETAAESRTPETSGASQAPSNTVPSGEAYVLPDFRGAFFTTVSGGGQYSYLVFNPTYDFSSEYSEGQIISQSIEQGTAVYAGTEISVVVSKGPEKVPLPDYSDLSASDYVSRLSELGIKFRIEEEESSEVQEGNVVRCSKEIGDDVFVAENEEIVVYSAVKPKETTAVTNALEFPTDDERPPASESAQQTLPEDTAQPVEAVPQPTEEEPPAAIQ